ncbi:hypothetical protein ACHHRT_12840 [Desulfurivibrio sp. D14AmB]|uniref:multiheme c-type cytochrome n=1 Tax=Desulfurivibrio sp. D14AmB TaxID=3374370 RepID=UPI00376F4583
MKRKGKISRFLWVGLLALGVGFAGCSGDDGAPGPAGPPGTDGQDAATIAGATGADSPHASLCFSCHQNVSDDDYLVRAHMDNMGGEMFGMGALDQNFPEACGFCHGGFRPGYGGVGLGEVYNAATQHQSNRPASIFTSAVDDVEVNGSGELTITFTINNPAHGASVATVAPNGINAEFTVAKWVEDEGSWINLLQRSVTYDTGYTTVIRGGNLRVDATKITGTPVTGGVQYSYTYASDSGTRYGVAAGTPLDITASPLWRAPGTDDDPATYCDGDATCETYVGDIIDQIKTDAVWGDGTYRIGATGRDKDDEYVRFAAVADFTVAGGVVTAVSAPAPVNQISQASCNTCHGDRLTFPRNNIHGQQRPSVDVCFNCHNNYTYDSANSTAAADGWANISMNLMIHNIHSGIEGYMVVGNEYEDVVFPDWTLPGTKNCASCHVGDVPAADSSWNRKDASAAVACATCHGEGGYRFEYPGLSATHGSTYDYNCVACHGSVADGGFGLAFQKVADEYHGVGTRLEQLRAQREDYSYDLVSVENAVYGATPVVKWRVLDAAGDPLHLVTDISIDGGPRLHIGWGTGDDWVNEGSGEKSTYGVRDNDDGGRPVALNVATTGTSANTVISADGLVATTTFPAFTDAAAGKGHPFANLAVAEEGRRGFVAIHRTINDSGASRMLTSLVQPIVLGAGEVELDDARRNTVNATTEPGRGGSCLSCHGTISWHGNSYTADNNIQACIVCHNAGSHRSIAVMALEGEEPHSVDMMYLMHAIHTSEDTLYPNDKGGRCHACHTGSDNDAKGQPININSGEVTNCTLCHEGKLNQGRLGVISDWPGSIDRYGLRGDGTHDGE